MTEIDLSTITVPVNFLWMNGDTLCPKAYQQTWTDLITTNVAADDVDFDAAGDPHGYPAGANDLQFMEALVSLFAGQGAAIDPESCAFFNW